jgi:hypothetical protein
MENFRRPAQRARTASLRSGPPGFFLVCADACLKPAVTRCLTNHEAEISSSVVIPDLHRRRDPELPQHLSSFRTCTAEVIRNLVLRSYAKNKREKILVDDDDSAANFRRHTTASLSPPEQV